MTKEELKQVNGGRAFVSSIMYAISTGISIVNNLGRRIGNMFRNYMI